MADINLIVTPPAITRASKSKLDPSLVAAMVVQLSADHWISDGKTYKTNKEAANALGLYRRILPKAAGVPSHQIKTLTYGLDKQGNPVTDRTKQADWRFGIKLDPERQPRQRRSNGSGSANAG